MRTFRNILVFWSVALVPIFHAAAQVQDVSQQPPGVSGVVGPNVMWAFSIEFPTAGEAHTERALNNVDKLKNVYIGYFDPAKCYSYSGNPSVTKDGSINWNAINNDDYFYPSAMATRDAAGVLVCSGGKWSGNVLNWVSMSAIDVVRSTLTGGNRALGVSGGANLAAEYANGDAASATYLRRAFVQDGKNRGYGFNEWQRTIENGLVNYFTKITPYGDVKDKEKLYFSSNKWKFALRYTNDKKEVVTSIFNAVVKVCDKNSGLEENCVEYKNGNSIVYKPVGLIQSNAEKMRFGVFTYLQDNNYNRDGGVLRARMKNTGVAGTTVATSGASYQQGAEWSGTTGQFALNPDANDATASGVGNSGVVNSINKFGDASGYKSYDPGAELFYAALRYFRKKGHVASYADNLTAAMKDGFPVITDWDDPVKYSCQNNFIIYMGDTNTHGDVDLPGSKWTVPSGNQLALRAPVDGEVDVNVWLNKINTSTSGGVGLGNTGSSNSPSYMAALAYWANVNDVRSDLTGQQNVKSFMIDTVEDGRAKTAKTNSFYLAGKWGGFIDSNGDKLPDLEAEWRDTSRKVAPDTDGLPNNYAQANNPQAMVKSLKAAIQNVAKVGFQTLGKPAVTNTAIPPSGYVLAFWPSFDADKWTGDLQAKKIEKTGVAASVWSAQSALESMTISTRSIFTWHSAANAGKPFVSDQQWLVDIMNINESGQNDGNGVKRVNYLRGDRIQEAETASPRFRPRNKLLGDIVNSLPVFIPTPIAPPAGCDYPANTNTAILARKKMVAIGANDGMLHIFNADNGQELMAYVPSSVHGKLVSLTNPSYSHRYYVDGSVVSSNVCMGSTPEAKTVLIGTTGIGGNGVFALDVTKLGTATAASASNVMWEFNSTDDARLGLTAGQPQLVKLRAGVSGGVAKYRYAALVGNGLNATTGNTGSLFILYLDGPTSGNWTEGVNYRRIDLPTTTPAGDIVPNALMSPAAVDTDIDGVTDLVYAGDINGNLWKIDLSNDDPVKWAVANGGDITRKPLFKAYSVNSGSDVKQQAIVAPPLVIKHPGGGQQVLFGTGKLFSEADRSSEDRQYLYGIHDPVPAKILPGCNRDTDDASKCDLTIEPSLGTTTSAKLTAQTLGLGSTDNDTFQSTSTTEMGGDSAGWYLPMLAKERVLVRAALVQGRVQFTSTQPSTDACSPNGVTWITELRPLNGKSPKKPIYDTNMDGKIDDQDDRSARNKVGGLSGEMLNLQTEDGTVKRIAGNGDQSNSGFSAFARMSWREIVGNE